MSKEKKITRNNGQYSQPVSNAKRKTTPAIQFKDQRSENQQLTQIQHLANTSGLQQPAPVQKKPNNTGLPNQLKSGIENLSGHSLDNVKVHYNSSRPAQLNAHAYAQGTDIHLAAGQEKHLPHEAWHVVQQKQGRVQPTMQLKEGVNINDDNNLENEATIMGDNALKTTSKFESSQLQLKAISEQVIQRIKLKYPGVREEKDAEKKPADPFQMATVQFDGTYDVHAYHSEIYKYAYKCKQQKQIPVIEFRYYDASFRTGADKYHQLARAHISKIITDQPFDMVFSFLRDETKDPTHNPPEATEEMDLFGSWLSKATDHDFGTDQASSKRIITGNKDVKGEKMEALDHPAEKMLSGNMMVPLEEAMELAQKKPKELNQIHMGESEEHYSLHHRMLAKILAKSKDLPFQTPEQAMGKEEMIEPVKPRLIRSNSMVKPESVTITNLVTGSEKDSLKSTLTALQAAFTKGAEFVFLIIEMKGTDSDRAFKQMDAMEHQGYSIQVISGIKQTHGVQQSGVKLGEPGKEIPERIKIKVSIAKDMKHVIGNLPPLETYHQWFQRNISSFVPEGMDKHSDEIEFESTYGPSFVDDLCATWPNRLDEIEKTYPDWFKGTYDHFKIPLAFKRWKESEKK